MTNFTMALVAGVAIGSVAAPAAAQYQNYPQSGYPQQSRNYQQGYNNPVGAIVDQLLGNRYNVTDRQAVSQCASAAMAQASSQYGGYNQRGGLRVTGITDVQRRSNGLRVSGVMSSSYGRGRYSDRYDYENRSTGGGDVTFRCNVDYRGAVTNIRIGHSDNGYRR